MSTTLYKALGNPYLKQVVRDIINASNELNIDFFAVGALARNVWYVENNLAPRGTQDVDFAVYIPDEKTYLLLKSKLIQGYNYIQSSENPLRLIALNKTPVDLLPFGQINQNNKTLLDSKGLTNRFFDGFEEVYQNGIGEINIEGDSLKICTIPAVIMLKLIAFDDRPEIRQKDPVDIASIIKYYPDIESNLIWDEYNFLYEGDLDHDEVGVIVIGYEIAKLISQNIDLQNRLLGILNKAIELSSSLAQHMIIDSTTETIKEKTHLLTLLKMGIEKKYK